MNDNTEFLIALITLGLIFCSYVLLFVYLLSNDEKKPNASEFCVQNGYVGARLNDIRSGYCYYPHQNLFDVKDNQYFGWDGTNWRFVK